MDYKSLHYMLVLQEEGLLSLAARRLGISQSSLSLFLLRLEQQYQTPLYDRKKHCMTEAGRIYCEGAGKVLLLHDKALEDIRTLSEHPSFSLGFPVCMNESLAPLTAALIRESALCDPLVSLRISFFPEQRLREMLQQNEFDLIYSYFPRSGIDTLNRQSLLKEPLLLAVPQDCPYREPGEIFRSLSYIAMFPGTTLRSACDAYFYMHHLSPFAKLESGSYGFTRAMMDTGGYATLLPAGAARFFSGFRLCPAEPALEITSGFYLPKDPQDSPYSAFLRVTLKRLLLLHFTEETAYESE